MVGSEQMYVTELCELAHVSERTLQYAFREVLGMSPTAYLNRLRLHHLRRDLLKANYASSTVSDMALSRGFWHFSDFARVYKASFGESPSATLRRVAA
jgi:transcriptional regulator GlxA family with amidase domain